MTDSPLQPGVSLDAKALGVAALNRHLRELQMAENEPAVRILGLMGQHGLATGIANEVRIELIGMAGSNFGMLNAAADLDLTGDAGSCCGHSMTGGGILVRGHVGHSAAAFAHGGFIGVHGTAKSACGLFLNGADVVVRQAVGDFAARGMRSGNLVLGSDVGNGLGQDCTGGTIYVRGTVASISDCLREARMKEADSMRLGLLLVRAGIKGAVAKDFRIYRPRVKSEE